MLKPEMEESLIQKLDDARVLDVVEPFWFSEFHEVGTVDHCIYLADVSFRQIWA